jgi:hypothetical protein
MRFGLGTAAQLCNWGRESATGGVRRQKGRAGAGDGFSMRVNSGCASASVHIEGGVLDGSQRRASASGTVGVREYRLHDGAGMARGELPARAPVGDDGSGAAVVCHAVDICSGRGGWPVTREMEGWSLRRSATTGDLCDLCRDGRGPPCGSPVARWTLKRGRCVRGGRVPVVERAAPPPQLQA